MFYFYIILDSQNKNFVPHFYKLIYGILSIIIKNIAEGRVVVVLFAH